MGCKCGGAVVVALMEAAAHALVRSHRPSLALTRPYSPSPSPTLVYNDILYYDRHLLIQAFLVRLRYLDFDSKNFLLRYLITTIYSIYDLHLLIKTFWCILR